MNVPALIDAIYATIRSHFQNSEFNFYFNGSSPDQHVQTAVFRGHHFWDRIVVTLASIQT